MSDVYIFLKLHLFLTKYTLTVWHPVFAVKHAFIGVFFLTLDVATLKQCRKTKPIVSFGFLGFWIS